MSNLKSILEQELAEAQKKVAEVQKTLAEAQKEAAEAAQELRRIENTYNAYMNEEQARRGTPSFSFTRNAPPTMHDRITRAAMSFGQHSFTARAVFDALRRSDIRYESMRPTITTVLRQLEASGQLESVERGIYKKKV